MAKYLRGHRNPDVFGEDIMDLFWLGLGAGGSEFFNQKVTLPLATKFVNISGTVGKAADGITTIASAGLVGWGVGMIDRKVGKDMRKGGIALGIAKLASMIIPGFSMSASFPNIPGFPSFAAKPAAPAVAASTNGAASNTRLLGVGSMGI